ncbi:hypothetical protein ABZ471_29415 [Streptomyces sp. NPDC005728]|uniref:NHL domain-containing protein n=1 Tax=Streptomyces sp. NPDC005728 TaxID=3157054 RepID=UPI0033F4744B
MTATAAPAMQDAEAQEAGTIWLVAGNGKHEYKGDGNAAVDAALARPTGLALSPFGDIYFSDRENHRVRKIDASGEITTIVGGGTDEEGAAGSVSITSPCGLALDSKGNLYIADNDRHRVLKVTAKGGRIDQDAAAEIWAGGGNDRDSSQASNLSLSFHWFTGLAVDHNDDLYIADFHNHRVVRIDQKRHVHVVAGRSGDGGNEGDRHQPQSAKLNNPAGLAFDTKGRLYICDQGNQRVRRVDFHNNTIEHVIGRTDGSGGHDSETQAKAAKLERPQGLAIDSQDTVFLTCRDKHLVRRVKDGRIETIAGKPDKTEYRGDGYAATTAEVNRPLGLLLDTDGNLYIADQDHDRVRRITKAGVGRASFNGGNGGDDHVDHPVNVKTGDETKLTVEQKGVPSAKPGTQYQPINVAVYSSTLQAVNPGVIKHTFTAPDGYHFMRQTPEYRYYNGTAPTPNQGMCDYTLDTDRKVLTIMQNPHVNNTANDRTALVYTLYVEADANAKPGTYSNGSACVGSLKPCAPLEGVIK